MKCIQICNSRYQLNTNAVTFVAQNDIQMHTHTNNYCNRYNKTENSFVYLQIIHTTIDHIFDSTQ